MPRTGFKGKGILFKNGSLYPHSNSFTVLFCSMDDLEALIQVFNSSCIKLFVYKAGAAYNSDKINV